MSAPRSALFACLCWGIGSLVFGQESVEEAVLTPSEVVVKKAAATPEEAAESADPSDPTDPTDQVARSGEMETDAMIWGGLVLAVDGEFVAPKGGGDFDKLSPRLAKVFPNKQFKLLGQHTQELFKQYESWVVPSKEIFLKLDSRGPAEGGGLKVHLQLWQDEAVPVKTDATLRPGSPLFISGPKYGEGTLIFVVLLKGGEDEAVESVEAVVETTD